MNFKVRCIDGKGGAHTPGKIYEVRNGSLQTDNSWFKGLESRNVDAINRHYISKFELVEEEKPFTKDDLKTGMFVATRNGRGFRLMLGTENGDYGLNQSTGTYIKLKCYNDDLTDKNNREWDIVKVESIKYPENMTRKLLWERKPEIHELTAEEAYKIIAEKKGVPVESLRVKWDR